MQESEERREQAMERVAARYKELDAQRASKRVVVMEGLVAPQKKKSGWGSWGGARTHSLSGARRGASAAATYAQSGGNKALAKARAESNRARLALTQASGRFSGPPVVHTRTARNAVSAEVEQAMFANPYAGRAKVAQGPRIPRPRAPLPMERRGELPAHIRPEKEEQKDAQRFSLGARAPAPRDDERDKGKGKRRDEPAPRTPTSFFEPKSRVLNAISDFKPLGSAPAHKRPREGRADSSASGSREVKRERNGEHEDKRQRTGSHEEPNSLYGSPANSPSGSPRGSPAPRTASPVERAASTPPRPLPARPRKPQNLESVLFMKKKRPVKRP